MYYKEIIMNIRKSYARFVTRAKGDCKQVTGR